MGVECGIEKTPFDWEKGQWNCFMKCLDCVTIRNSIKDTIVWGYSSSGEECSLGMCYEDLVCLWIWIVSFATMESRNQAVFGDKETNVWQAIDMVKFQVAWWFKHHSKGSKETLTDMLLNIKELCVDGKSIKKIRRADWIPPTNSDFKFNEDGSILGNLGPVGIGGVLRNCDGKLLCMFSCYIGINSAELVAIHKACALCVFTPSFVNRNIEIVSDSIMVVSLINGEGVGSINHVDLIYDICCSLEHFGGKVVYSSSVSNQFADRLAKLGSKMLGDFVEFGESSVFFYLCFELVWGVCCCVLCFGLVLVKLGDGCCLVSWPLSVVVRLVVVFF
ncbi:hypothetical protein Ddye_019465 [Dipteronia dyeriana]|uniref:RNase H type-1 domain-containing protein n=1 Tax=Dipteronia dyeriana TaxID=168575 RepID=A0AAD9TXZ4_9ROSI|nr:hypothetical protein Ddye_019465 [Dipteronia dyeriana]